MTSRKKGKAKIISGPTILSPDTFAGCWNPVEGWQLFIPRHDDDDIVPDEATALIGAMSRLINEPGFAAECIAYMERHHRSH